MSNARQFAVAHVGKTVKFVTTSTWGHFKRGDEANGVVCGYVGEYVIIDVSHYGGFGVWGDRLDPAATIIGSRRPKFYAARAIEKMTLVGADATASFTDDKTPVTPTKKVIPEYPHGPCKRPGCIGQTYQGFNVLVACSNIWCADFRKV